MAAARAQARAAAAGGGGDGGGGDGGGGDGGGGVGRRRLLGRRRRGRWRRRLRRRRGRRRAHREEFAEEKVVFAVAVVVEVLDAAARRVLRVGSGGRFHLLALEEDVVDAVGHGRLVKPAPAARAKVEVVGAALALVLDSRTVDPVAADRRALARVCRVLCAIVADFLAREREGAVLVVDEMIECACPPRRPCPGRGSRASGRTAERWAAAATAAAAAARAAAATAAVARAQAARAAVARAAATAAAARAAANRRRWRGRRRRGLRWEGRRGRRRRR